MKILKIGAIVLAGFLCAGCDFVEVVELTSSHTTPLPGTLVTVRARVRNTSSLDLRRVMVDVNIPNVRPLASLYRDFVSLGPGDHAEVQYQFVVKIGMNVVTACVDPDNALGETPDDRRNNCKSIDLTRYTTQELDFQRAGRSGATFADGVEHSGTCRRVGVADSFRAETYANGQRGAVFVADCPSFGSFVLVPIGTGGKATASAYRDFTLQNGWTVASVETAFTTNREMPSSTAPTLEATQSPGERTMEGFAFTSPPVVGSSTPSMTAHFWVEPGAFLNVFVKMIIKGPEGTEPYPPVTQPCFSGWGDGTAFFCGTNADCAPPFTCIGGCCLRD